MNREPIPMSFPLPSAIDLADAFADFGEQRHQAVTTARALPPAAQRLCIDHRVKWLPDGHQKVPEAIRDVLDRVRDLSPTRRPSICARRRDGQAWVVLGRLDAMSHEVIHVGQGFVSRDVKDHYLGKVAQQGHTLLKGARNAVRHGANVADFSDLTVMRQEIEQMKPNDTNSVWARQREFDKPCSSAISEIAASQGLTTPTVIRACVYAAYLEIAGAMDSTTLLGLELVAYRYEGQQDELEHLYKTAVTTIAA